MKKVLLFLLLLCLVFSFAGCKEQPSVQSSSDTATTSEQTVTTSKTTVTTTSEQTTSTNTSTSKPQPSSSSKPSATTSQTPSSTTSAASSTPAYSGTYLDDMTPAQLKFSYDSLKTKLEQYIKTIEPTKVSDTAKTFDISANYKDYELLGYSASHVTTAELKVVADADLKIKNISYVITMAYKSGDTIEQMVIRDMNKLLVFTDNAEINYFLNREFGNPDEFTNFDDLNAAENTRRMYKGQRNNSFINLQYLNADKSVKTAFIVGTTNQNGILKTTVKVQINY